MNELLRTIEAAFAAAPEGDTRELLGKALDMLDTIPNEPLEMMVKAERVKETIRWELSRHKEGHILPAFHAGWQAGLAAGLRILGLEFPDV